MTKKEKLVSIILNCYNGEKYLSAALNSVKNQTYKNWELIFWDNKSKDRSKKIFYSYSDTRFKYFQSKKHSSLYAARNLAVQKAKGKFLAFIDSDDLWEKNKLEKQIKHFQDKSVGVVYGNLWVKQENLNKVKKHINYKIPEGYIHENLINNYYVGIISSVIRRKILVNTKKIFNDKYNIIGDYDLFLRLAKICKFKAIQEPVATYRIHQKNLSKLDRKLEGFELEDWLKNNKKNLKKNQYEKIKIKVEKLKFIGLKFDDSFLNTLLFFFSSIRLISSFKNLAILFLPKYILRKFMWFV